MTISYRIIKYVEDPMKDEGRNLGIIATEGQRRYFRAAGLDKEGKPDLSLLAGFAGKKVQDDAWVLAEWLDWFSCIVEEEPDDVLMMQLDKLQDCGSNIVVRGGGDLVSRNGDPVEKGVDDIFKRLVGPVRRPTADYFQERVKMVLEQAGITQRQDYLEDVEVKFAEFEGRPAAMAIIPFLLESKPRIVFKTVKFRGASEAMVRDLNDAVFTFRIVMEHGFAEEDRRVLLTDRFLPNWAAGLWKGHVVNISAKNAEIELRKLL